MVLHETNCAAMELLLQADIDGELDAAQAAGVMQHLAQCGHCSALQQRLLLLRAALRSELPRHQPAVEFEAALRRRLAAASPPQRLVSTPIHKRWRAAALVGSGAALAASLLLSIGTPLQSSLIDGVVTEHIRSLQAEHLLDVVSTDQHTVKPWFNGKLDFVPPVKDFAAQGFPLSGGRLDYLDGRTVAALIYHRGQHPINVFVWPSGWAQKIVDTSSCTQRAGYNICWWSNADMRIWAISDLNAAELQQFAALWNL